MTQVRLLDCATVELSETLEIPMAIADYVFLLIYESSFGIQTD